MSTTAYIRADGELVQLPDITAFEALVRRLEADQDLLTCTIAAEGGAGSTLLNFTLPDFTPEEELALVRIFMTASERTLQECKDSIKLCNRRMAEFQGFRVIKGGEGHDG